MTEPLRSADVFVSYSRRDKPLCDSLVQILEGDLNLSVFVDSDIAPGARWEVELRKQLSAQNRPALVVLATMAAVESPEQIRKEIAIALDEKLLVVPIGVNSDAAANLLGNAAIHELRLNGESLSCARVVTELRRALLAPRLERALEARRAQMKDWLAQHHQADSFWAATWPAVEREFRKTGGLALVGPGGAGKSTLAALVVAELNEAPWCAIGDDGADRTQPVIAILLSECDLHDDGQGLATELGAHSAADLQEFLEASRRACPFRLIFVVDALDQMAPDNSSSFRKYALALNAFSRAAPTLVTCRPEVWAQAYSPHVSMPARAIDQLEPEVAAAALAGLPRVAPIPVSGILRRPLFLDIAVRFGKGWEPWPNDEMGLLDRLWRTLAVETRDPRTSTTLQPRMLLGYLAALQVEHARFDVALDDLRERMGGPIDRELAWLKQVRMLRIVADDRVRFTHDVLDAFSMVLHLANQRPEQRQGFFTHLADDGIWSVVSMLAAYGACARRAEVTIEVFECFLRVLDRKAWGVAHMARAWAATYALQERFETFCPLILAAFATDTLAPQLALNSTEGGSSLVPPVLTQDAGSSLASAFQALHVGSVADAPVVLPRLLGKLDRWKFRSRIIEAIAKFVVPEARQALVAFVERNLLDVEEVGPVVTALSELQAFDHPAVVALLRNVVDDEAVAPKIRRQAVHSLNRLMNVLIPVPPRDDAELIEDLRVYDIDKNGLRKPGYSDWRVVESAAQEMVQRVHQGVQPAPDLVKALVLALGHDHTAVRCFVAGGLALLQTPMAVLALVSELSEHNVPDAVRASCVDALRQQLSSRKGLERQAMRCTLLRAAQAAAIRGQDIPAIALRQLLASVPGNDEWPCDEYAALLTPLSRAHQGFATTLEWADKPIAAEIAALVTPEELAAAGAELERKFRYSALAVSDGRLQIQASASSWGLARAFHTLAHRSPDRLDGAARDQFALPLPLGRLELPGLAVVHAIASTSDGKLLMAQRSTRAAYSPGRWSISFEEQATIDDSGLAEHPIDTARRGFREEFGLDIPAQHVDVLGAILEIQTLNVAIVVHLRCRATSAEIQRSWATDPRPVDHHEAEALAFLEFAAAKLEATPVDTGVPASLHPTSRMRLRLLSAAHAPA